MCVREGEIIAVNNHTPPSSSPKTPHPHELPTGPQTPHFVCVCVVGGGVKGQSEHQHTGLTHSNMHSDSTMKLLYLCAMSQGLC